MMTYFAGVDRCNSYIYSFACMGALCDPECTIISLLAAAQTLNHLNKMTMKLGQKHHPTNQMDVFQACVKLGLMNEQLSELGISALTDNDDDDLGNCLGRAIVAQVSKQAASYRLMLVELDSKAIRESCLHMSLTEEDILCRLLEEQVSAEVRHFDTCNNSRLHHRAALLEIIHSITSSNMRITRLLHPDLHSVYISLKHRVIQDIWSRIQRSAVANIRLSL